MSTKAARGTKRTCQNTDCGARFYDLMRDPILCPVCGTAFVQHIPAAAAAAAVPAAAAAPDFIMPEGMKAEDAPAPEGEEALADIESADEPAVAADDETFLEEEDDGNNDMTGLVGDAGDEPEEQ
jgi:uncharacterized protein (TIGR02300 family)